VVLNKSLYEQLKMKHEQEALQPEQEEEELSYKHDYLAPYLPKTLKHAKSLSLTEAEAVYTACTSAAKERLIDRSHIIESRLEDEQQALARRQTGYQRQDKDKAAEEEYEKYVQEATFRIQILKQRRDRHTEMATAKYNELLQTLAEDPRLTILNKKKPPTRK